MHITMPKTSESRGPWAAVATLGLTLACVGCEADVGPIFGGLTGVAGDGSTGDTTGTSGVDAGGMPTADAGGTIGRDAAITGVDGGLPAEDGGLPAEDGGLPAADGSLPPEDGAVGGARKRDVLMVGNSVAGTVSFIDPYTFENLGSVNVIPDIDEVLLEINLNPVLGIGYQVVKNQQLLHHFEPHEGDRYVDDLFVSPEGTVLYVSRSNLGDVAAIDLADPEHPVLWRRHVDGFKADHAAISPDGKHIAVSATSAQVTDIIDTATGEIVDSFPTGYYPHQNDYTPDGKYVYNSSIGNVGYESVSYADNDQKGDRWLVKADAETMEIVDTWEFEWGIRPNVFTPDEKILYTQLSYLNGVVKYDLENKQEIARNVQPLSQFALDTYASYDEYPHDSAHHGLALSGDGTKLCDCGTVDNTVAIVGTDDMKLQSLIDVGLVPYWATTGPSGQYCFVSLSGDDAVSVVSYETGQEVAVVPVGKFPQRNRVGSVLPSVIDNLAPSDG